MKIFEIDVSGEDLLNKDYTICVADKNNLIRGFKFLEELVNVLCSRYGQGMYKYAKSKKGKADFKVRLYCISLYFLFSSIKGEKEISLKICRDFPGKTNEISKMLRFFLEDKLGFALRDRIYFEKLSPESNAHKYAYMMRLDSKNKINTYVDIKLEDFEQWLKK